MTRTEVAAVGLQLDEMRDQFIAALPKHIPVERFIRVVRTAVRENPDLREVDPRSLLNAAMRAAQDGLLPDGRHGALVIYRDKRRGPIAQWLPMIAGIRQKVRNSGEVATWEVHVVHEKDLFEYELGDHPQIVHRPAHSADRGKIVAAYSVAVLKSGDISREVMWLDEIEDIRRLSKAGDSGPWKSFFGEMCKKTVARRHAKVLPMSTDMDDLLRRDDDEPGAGVGPAIPPATKQVARKSQAEVLSMMTDPLAGTVNPYRRDGTIAPPEGYEVDEDGNHHKKTDDDGQTDLVEAIEGKVEARHG